jgi:hypothetical protein
MLEYVRNALVGLESLLKTIAALNDCALAPVRSVLIFHPAFLMSIVTFFRMTFIKLESEAVCTDRPTS